MIETGPQLISDTTKLPPVKQQEQHLGQDVAIRKETSLMADVETVLLQSLSGPSEDYQVSQNLEQSPDLEEQGQAREWQNGYKSTRRQKKKPRPGETTFRVPMSTEQRKSLGVSVRPRESQGLENVSGQVLDTEEIISADTPLSSITRGGTKLKFRAYGPSTNVTNTRFVDGLQLSSNPSSMIQEAGVSEQQTIYQHYDPETPRIMQDTEFLSAPLDNGPKFAWWLAQQISHINSWQTSNNMVSRLPELTVSQFYGHNESPIDRRRQIERQRKAKWREANAEKNRENDLRARVKRQARVKFGDVESPEMNNWIASEVARRKARREDKQILQAAKSGHYPLFADSDLIRHTLLGDGKVTDLNPAVQEVKKLIIDVLFPATGTAEKSSRLDAIELLSRAVDLRQSQEDESFQAALTSISQDETVFNAARSLMEQFKSEDDEDTGLDGRCGDPGQGNTLMAELSNTTTLPSQTIASLNEALAILSELNELGNEQQATCVPNSAMDAATRQQQRRQALQDMGVSESQLDEFLVLANGGPLESDPDDDLAKELHGKQLVFDIPALPQQQINSQISDSAAWDIVNSVLETLLQRCIPPPKRGRRTNQVMAREVRAKKQAMAFRTLLSKIEIGGNYVRSRIESQAMSEFYNRMTSFSKTGSFGMSLYQPYPQHQQNSALSNLRSPPIRVPGTGRGRKRKYAEDTFLVENSPTVTTTLPNATNPFADNQQKITPAISSHIPSPTNTIASVQSTTPTRHSPHKVQHTVSLSSPVESRIQVLVGYPQFRSTHPSETFRS